jgi:hypothetical protein
VPSHCRMRAFDRDLIRGGHYGQRSCEPHLQAEHMAALTQACIREESPCEPGAVHTWHKTDMPTRLAPKSFMRSWADLVSDQTELIAVQVCKVVNSV